MSNPFTVTAIWDPEAKVFTSQSDIPGLVVEAATFEELVDLVEALAPEVIAANLPDIPPPQTRPDSRLIAEGLLS
jgi:Domain of unknown function (DUF1902)